MDQTSLSERFADFTAGLRLGDVPADVADVARINLLDSLGVMAASSTIDAGVVGRAIVGRLGGTAEATVVGLPERVPAVNAVLANGVLVHALDYDDSHSPSITHPSGVVVTTALSVGEAVGASGEDVLTAAVAGYEMITRIGSVAPGELIKNGFHTTGITGAFAAALVSARLLGLSREQTVSALGLAGSQVSGLMEFLADGSDAKQLHAGWACHAGVFAALLAQQGLTGPRTVFEGRQGFFSSFLAPQQDQLDLSVMDDLGERWRTTDIVYKAYPVCHLNHAIIDVIRSMRAETPFAADDVEAVTCFVPDWYVNKIVEPIEHKRNPRTTYEARFSLPYSVATTILSGDVPIEAFTRDAITNPEAAALASRVSYQVEDFPEFPASYPGGLSVRLRDGRDLRGYQRFTRALTRDEVLEKFLKNVRASLGEAVGQEVLERAMSIGSAPVAARDLMEPFRFDAARRGAEAKVGS